MNPRFPVLVLLSAAALLASCSGALSCGDSHPYANYAPQAPLAAPAGVTLPRPDAAYLVPAAGTGHAAVAAPAAATGHGAQPCLVIPPKVLTRADMGRTAKPESQAPAAGTRPQPQAAPAPATHSPHVAAGGPME